MPGVVIGGPSWVNIVDHCPWTQPVLPERTGQWNEPFPAICTPLRDALDTYSHSLLFPSVITQHFRVFASWQPRHDLPPFPANAIQLSDQLPQPAMLSILPKSPTEVTVAFHFPGIYGLNLIAITEPRLFYFHVLPAGCLTPPPIPRSLGPNFHWHRVLLELIDGRLDMSCVLHAQPASELFALPFINGNPLLAPIAVQLAAPFDANQKGICSLVPIYQPPLTEPQPASSIDEAMDRLLKIQHSYQILVENLTQLATVPVVDAPICATIHCANATYQLLPQQTLPFVCEALQAEGKPLSYVVTDTPRNGTLEKVPDEEAERYIYTASRQSSYDMMEFEVTDSEFTSSAHIIFDSTLPDVQQSSTITLPLLNALVEFHSSRLGAASRFIRDHKGVCVHAALFQYVWGRSHASQAELSLLLHNLRPNGAQNGTELTDAPLPHASRKHSAVDDEGQAHQKRPRTGSNSEQSNSNENQLSATLSSVAVAANAASSTPGVALSGDAQLVQELHTAIPEGDIAKVTQLLEAGVSVNGLHDCVPPLRVAAWHGQTEILRLLLAHGADVNYVARKDLGTPIMSAALMGHLDCVEILLQHGTDINHQAHTGGTTLFCTTIRGHTAITKLLLDAHIDMEQTAHDGTTALHMTAMGGRADDAKMLLEYGCRPDVARADGITPLCFAAAGGHMAIVEMLLARGANPRRRTDDGMTALCYAADAGHADICKLLLAHGAPVDGCLALPHNKDLDPKNPQLSPLALLAMTAPDLNALAYQQAIRHARTPPPQTTPLHNAAGNGHEAACKVLLAAGADCLLKVCGQTPMGVAQTNGHNAVLALMRAHMQGRVF